MWYTNRQYGISTEDFYSGIALFYDKNQYSKRFSKKWGDLDSGALCAASALAISAVGPAGDADRGQDLVSIERDNRLLPINMPLSVEWMHMLQGSTLC
ncbi:hypothetical protein GOP47_0028258 [Adiantum capillus-veneris]|nr:hypothetical protein GOP47_0028258 [Adiantum capillus-veneris]